MKNRHVSSLKCRTSITNPSEMWESWDLREQLVTYQNYIC